VGFKIEFEEIPNESQQETVVAISVAAVIGSEGNITIRLWASIHCQRVLILVDSGSSASYMGNHLMGVMPGVAPLHQPLQVKVADGGRMWSTHVMHGCRWLCKGVTFITDFKLLPLSGYDLILGMDWLKDHSPMSIPWGHK
jgi:hypothetical protein